MSVLFVELYACRNSCYHNRHRLKESS